MKAPLLTYFGEPIATKHLKLALKKENNKIQLKGLVGSSFALTSSAIVRESSVPHLFIFRDKEEASYFINDIESLLNNEISCNLVVNASGAWADDIANVFNIKPVNVIPKIRTVFVFKPKNIDSAIIK